MKKNRILVVTSVLCTLIASVALAQPSTPPLGTDFTALPGFPGPAEGYDSVGVDALESGELVVYDGSSVHLETDVEADTYTEYTGFDGTGGLAGFVAASPDSSALIGANSTGSLWLFDADAPAVAGDPLGTVEGVLFGEFLDDTNALVSVYVEAELGKQAASELGIVDTANTAALYTAIVDMGDGVPGGLVVAGDLVYTTNAATGQIRTFDVDALLDAVATKQIIDWEDGDLVGTFNDFGPTAVSSQCTLLVSGNDATTGRGAIQFISRAGEFGGDVQISGEAESAAHMAVYNPDTEKIIAVVTDDSGEGVTVNAYVSNSSYEAATIFTSLLALLAGAGGLILLLIVIFGLL